MILGGQAAEEFFYGDITTGPSSDLKKATSLAKSIVMEYGMNNILGPRTFGETQEMVFLGKEISSTRDYSEKVAEIIDSEIEKLVKEAKETALRIIKEKKDKMDEIVAILMEQETIEKEEFEKICGPKPLATR